MMVSITGPISAWMIVATALVFLMTPGLAFFYGGMVNRKNVISTMIKSLIAAGLVSVLWIAVGYSLCFGRKLAWSDWQSDDASYV